MADYRAAARRAAQKYGVDPAIFLRMIQQESGFNPNARSGAGAQGIAQFMPATARAYGVNLNDGRAQDDLEGAARYLRDNLRRTGGSYARALSIYNSGRPDAYKDPKFAGGQTYNYVRSILNGRDPVATGSSSQPASVETTRMVGGVDNSRLRKQAIVNFLLDNSKAKDPVDLALRVRQLADVPGTPVTSEESVSGDNATGPYRSSGGVASFEGKNVPAWMVPALRYARQNGWKGSITSGVRTRQEQARLYANRGSNPFPVARPGTSNHEIDAGGGGAIDVSNPDQLEQILAGFKGRRPRRDPSIKDPVHFSRSGR